MAEGQTGDYPRVDPPNWFARRGLQDFSWSLPLVGLCMFTMTIVTYRLPVAEAGMAIAVLGMALQIGKVRIPFPIWLSAAFVAWSLVAALASPFPQVALDNVAEQSKQVVIMLVVVNALRTPGQLRFYLLFFLACYLLYPVRGSLLGGERLFGRALWGHNMFNNPNDLAAISLMALGVSFGLLFSSSTRVLARLLYLAGVLLILVVILLTQSRGAFLGFVVGMGPALLWSGLKRPVRMILLGAIAATVIALAAPAGVWERYAGIGELRSSSTIAQADPEGSAAERYEIQKVALRIFLDHPFFGVGLGAYPYAHNFYDPAFGMKSTHNMYLNLAAEVGLPGLIIWLAMLVSTLRFCYRRRKLAGPSDVATVQAWLERALVAYLVAALFGNFHKMTFAYLFLAVVWSAGAMLPTPATKKIEGPARPAGA